MSVSGNAFPPVAETRMIPTPGASFPNIITPSLFQEPPTASPGSSQMVCAGPPATSIFLNFPRASYATNRLSGDQTGMPLASSVPLRGRASNVSKDRIQRRGTPSSPVARKASLRPSGETPKKSLKVTLSGGVISKRTVSAAGGFGRRYRKPSVSAARRNAAAALGHNHETRWRGVSAGDSSSSNIHTSPMSRRRCLGSFSRHFFRSRRVLAGTRSQSGCSLITEASVSAVVSP